MEILDKYSEELNNDTRMDEINIKEVQLKLPGLKHKWIARLIKHKSELKKLNKLKELAKEKIVNKLTSDPNITLSKISLEKKAESNETMKKIVDKINDEQLIIAYLEKVETIFRSFTYDIKNVVEIMKLETL